MAIIISEKISEKLGNEQHQVTEKEVQEAFNNRTGKLLFDTRERHRTDPPTMWFVACTNHRRLLKVCFIQRDAGSYIRTAYTASEVEVQLYRKHGQPSDF